MVEAALRSFQRDGLPVEVHHQNQQKCFNMQIPGPHASLLNRNGKVGPRLLLLNASLLTGAQLWLTGRPEGELEGELDGVRVPIPNLARDPPRKLVAWLSLKEGWGNLTCLRMPGLP